MSIRKMWLLALMLIAVFSVTFNALVLSTLTDKFFKEYMTENHKNHMTQIVFDSTKFLTEGSSSETTISVKFEMHLVDPITRIRLYNAKNILVLDISATNNMRNHSMMGRKMMNSMMNAQFEEIENIELIENGRFIGQLNITKYSSIENSIQARMFKASLISNSFYSIVVVLIISLLIGLYISKKMSKALMNTAEMAKNIDLGIDSDLIPTKIIEIKVIQQSLEALIRRLKLKQKSRTILIDELVHQARTPLTILKTHLEGFSDGIIEMTPKEIGICENQINNMTAIISNMSNMIDAEKDFDGINLEKFDFNLLINQIVAGLKVQFEQKKIRLQLHANEKVILYSDKYKLSQAIYNVLTNAYKFTKKNGHVKIHSVVYPEKLVVYIDDTGIGIPQKNLDRIFEAYYRANESIDTSGEGIGLYIAKENLVKIHGSIQVKSKVGVGTSFMITVPLDIST